MAQTRTIKFKSAKAGGTQRLLNVRRDPPDLRDRWYEPALVHLEASIDNRHGAKILDQGQEGACTGFGCAAVVNQLSALRGNAFFASPRMLYEMGKKHDEWPGEDYAGSSCRGVIRGWKNMGVCSEAAWEYDTAHPGELTVERAIAARHTPLGAYYRLRADIVDYHAALNEVGALFVSARVHSGWWDPGKHSAADPLATILPSRDYQGGHAFAIIGYDENGFLVQNSWGPQWGSGGFARWRYEDWVASVVDGWVFRLGLPTPQIFGLTARSAPKADAESGGKAPKRLEIAGHFSHFDDGRFKERGDYWTTRDDIQRTADRIGTGQSAYEHLLVYVHGGLNSPKASARRIAALKEGFKRNGIYPFHIMYDTGLVEELKDVVLRAFTGAQRRAEGFLDWLQDEIVERTDTLIEDALRKPVTPLWDEMKRDARLPFETGGDGLVAMETLAATLKDSGMKIHLAGHSTGGVLIGHLLSALDRLGRPDLVSSCSLMAPACTIEFYQEHYAPRIGPTDDRTRLPQLDIYNLTDKLELDDNVVKAYRKSLLYLVSRALEREVDKPILGMEIYAKALPSKSGLNVIYSNGRGKVSRSTSHGGFDNDPYTLNTIMTQVLGSAPRKPFQASEMEGY